MRILGSVKTVWDSLERALFPGPLEKARVATATQQLEQEAREVLMEEPGGPELALFICLLD